MSYSSAEARARMVARISGMPFDPAKWRREQERFDMDDRITRAVDRAIDKVFPGSRQVAYREDADDDSAKAARARMVQRIQEGAAWRS